jgi:transcriptional regulator with XRE-family HTH domain
LSRNEDIALVLHTHIVLHIDKSPGRDYEQNVTPDPIYKHIGAVIKSRRKTLTMNQEYLANAVGISRGSLANIEVGRQNVLVHQVYRIAEALGISPFDLLPAQEPVTSKKAQFRFSSPDLKAQQKEQIARLLEPDTAQVSEKEGSRGKTAKG